MKYFLLVCVVVFFLGCEVNKTNSSSLDSSSLPTGSVEVFTLARVLNAVVVDANNQVATYDEKTQKYFFKNLIKYPISVTSSTYSYIDIDYDNNKTASDLNISTKFLTDGLKSFCNEVNYLTSLYYDQNLSDKNITTIDYTNDIKARFNIDICADVLTNMQNAKVLFGTYNYIIKDNNLSTLSDIQTDVSEVDDFFNNYLSNITSDEGKIKYYSSYNSMVKLDMSLVKRVDTIHKPEISTILRDKLNIVDNNKVDVFDILPYGNDIYLAAGHDEFAKIDNDLTNETFSSNVELLSFGNRLSYQNFAGTDCIFLANSNAGLTTFEIDSYGFTKKANIKSYIDGNLTVNFSSNSILNSNNYVSINENKRLLGISTSDKGYYLINIKDSFSKCEPFSTDLNVTDFIIQENNDTATDAIFKDDGTYLYVAHKNKGIYGYKTDILDKDITTNTKKIYTMKNDREAYNLKLFNNDNTLFISTDKGILIYDVESSTQDLSYVSEYKSEGSKKDYYPYVDSYQDYIFFTDGYKGIKILKLDNSFHPMLCGVEYFAPKDNSFELAKTTSVKYDNEYLYVGVTSYGIVKFKLNDVLFEHCK